MFNKHFLADQLLNDGQQNVLGNADLKDNLILNCSWGTEAMFSSVSPWQSSGHTVAHDKYLLVDWLSQ